MVYVKNFEPKLNPLNFELFKIAILSCTINIINHSYNYDLYKNLIF